MRDALSGVTRRPRFAVALAVTFASAAALGVYAHWVWWDPYDALWIFLTVGVLLLGALILGVSRRSGMRRRSLVPLVGAVGLLLGAWFGPSRPALQQIDALVTATLERPGVSTGQGRGSCQTAGASELRLDGEMRLRIWADDPSAPADVDQRAFVSIFLSVGDRWRDRPIHRSDNVDLMVLVGSVAADEPDVALVADDGSLIELAWTEDAGSVRFDRLVVDTSRSEASGAPIDLAGTISWTCRDHPLPEGAAEIAESACADSTYALCVEDMLRKMVEVPGSLVAVCAFADGGAVISLEREEDATEWCAAEGPAGRALEVLRLLEE